MKQSGYSDKELQDVYTFLHVDKGHEAKQLCEKGVAVNNTPLTTLGHPKMGKLFHLPSHYSI